MKKICCIGHFSFDSTAANGQTVKTRVVTEELEKIYGRDSVLKMDTSNGIRSLLTAVFTCFSALKRCKNVLIFPAHNGVKVYAPLLAILRKLFGNRKLHYIVIGGWLPEFAEKYYVLRYFLKKFDCIYVETKAMQEKMRRLGFSNVYIMYNCKAYKICSEPAAYTENDVFRLCTFSRVSKEKGIEIAVDAVKLINSRAGKVICSLDIYGKADENQEEWFDALQKSFPAYIRYCGVAPFDKSTQILRPYFALLFPTFYDGEGFAGTIVDAFASGVPVIASDWRYNKELVQDGVTGIICQAKDVDSLTEALNHAFSDLDRWNEMKTSCLKKTNEYLPQNALRVLEDNLI